ncbi:MAG: hypothetical protein RLZZ04_2238 [Cyanobacteriota bacterium]|jgi:hypothetical protein
MLDNYKSVPFLACICTLLLIPLGIGALVYSSVRSEYTDQSTEKTEESSATGGSLGGASTKSSNQYTFPSSESSGGGGEIDATTGIPTGTYSNPPTTIKSGSETVPQKSTPLTEDFASSVDRNRSIQQSLNNSSIDNSFPDYSSPAPSNNYNNSQDNSLIKPLEENSLLESPTTTSETVPLAPVGEPLSEPSN